MRKLRYPNFGLNVKSYLYGEKLYDIARYCESLSEEFDIDITITCGYAELKTVKEMCPKLFVFAQNMDGLSPGRGMGAVLPESLLTAGIDGVILNHAEHPMTLNNLVRAIRRAKELGLIVTVCADNIDEARMIALLEPDEIICEQNDLIGTGITADEDYMISTYKAIKELSPDTIVVQGAGIKNGEDCYRSVKYGSLSTGGTSAICAAQDPKAVCRDMVEGTVRAINDFYGGKKFHKGEGKDGLF
jgi:triosephosphate isomerase